MEFKGAQTGSALPRLCIPHRLIGSTSSRCRRPWPNGPDVQMTALIQETWPSIIFCLGTDREETRLRHCGPAGASRATQHAIPVTWRSSPIPVGRPKQAKGLMPVLTRAPRGFFFTAALRTVGCASLQDSVCMRISFHYDSHCHFASTESWKPPRVPMPWTKPGPNGSFGELCWGFLKSCPLAPGGVFPDLRL